MKDDHSRKFRYDPRPYLRSLVTVEGIALRRSVLQEVAPGDWELGDRLMSEIVAEQDPGGSWGEDLEVTGRRMHDLLDLDVVPNHPALELAAEWSLDHLDPVFEGAVPFTLVQAPALLSLIRMGRSYEGPVQRVVSLLSYDVDRWLPEAGIDEIASAVTLLLADPHEQHSVAVPRAVDQLIRAVDAPCATDEDRYAALDTLGSTESGEASDWVERNVALVREAQEETGAWESHTAAVVRALCGHGLWESLLP